MTEPQRRLGVITNRINVAFDNCENKCWIREKKNTRIM